MSLSQYKKAVWQYMLEHSSVEFDSGSLFVKFHSGGRAEFEHKIYSRAAGYHRNDTQHKERMFENARAAVVALPAKSKVQLLEDFMRQEAPPGRFVRMKQYVAKVWVNCWQRVNTLV